MNGGAPGGASDGAKKKRSRKPKKPASATPAGGPSPVPVDDDAARLASLQSGNALVDEVLRQTAARSVKLTRTRVEETVSKMFEDGLQYDDVDAVVDVLLQAAGVAKAKPAPAAKAAVVEKVRPPWCVVCGAWRRGGFSHY